MRRIVWGLYGLGVAVGVLVLTDGPFGATEKSFLVIALLLFGALLAALLHLADRVGLRGPETNQGNVMERTSIDR